MRSEHKKVASTILITGIAFAVNYLITLILTPVITETVGTEAYGFVSLAKNIAQYATYAALALNSFATRYISVEYHKNDIKTANVYFSSTFYGDLAVGLIVFSVALAGIVFLEHIFRIPAQIVTDVKILFFFVFLKFLLATICSVYEAGAIISNRLYLTGVFKLISYLVEAFALVIMFSALKPNVFYVGVGIFAAAIVVELSNVWICKKYTPKLEVSKNSFSFQAVKTLVLNGIWSTINSLGSFLHSGLDLMICNLMLSPLRMGQLAIAESLSLIFKSIYTLVSQPFQPLFLKSYAQEDEPLLMRQLFASMKVSSLLSNLCYAGFAALGMAYYRLWIPKQDIGLIYKLTRISTISCISSGIIYPLFFVYTLKLKKMIPCMFTLISGAANVISMYFLIKYTSLGVYAVTWTTAVLMTFVNLVAHALYLAYVMNKPWATFYPNILRCTASCFLMTFIFKQLARIYTPSRWLAFAVTVLVYAVIGTVIHLVTATSKYEREMILSTLKIRKKNC